MGGHGGSADSKDGHSDESQEPEPGYNGTKWAHAQIPQSWRAALTASPAPTFLPPHGVHVSSQEGDRISHPLAPQRNFPCSVSVNFSSHRRRHSTESKRQDKES